MRNCLHITHSDAIWGKSKTFWGENPLPPSGLYATLDLSLVILLMLDCLESSFGRVSALSAINLGWIPVCQGHSRVHWHGLVTDVVFVVL